MNTTKIDYALHYRAQGLTPIPLFGVVAGTCTCDKGATCENTGKHPRVKRQTALDATEKNWQSWCATWPEMNIGILTGSDTGVFAVDIDPRHDGDKSLAQLFSEYGSFPATLSASTGGGGTHYLFSVPPGVAVRNSASNLGAGIDIRGNGGLIVVEPSATSGRYKWQSQTLPTRDQIAPPPDWLLQLITAPKAQTAPAADLSLNAVATSFLGFQMPPDGSVAEGGRNNFLTRAAGWLQTQGVKGGALSEMLYMVNTTKCVPPLERDEVEKIALSIARYDKTVPTTPASPCGWPETEELNATLPPVPPFDPRLLPPVFRAWVSDVAERMQCPVEFLAVGAMVAAGSVLGNRIGVQPKRLDTGWVEVPNLWGAVVGRPGVMKSPALDQVLAPLKALQASALNAFSITRAQYEIEKMMFESNKKQIEANIKKGAVVHAHQFPVAPEEPQPQRYLVNDATYQKLGDMLSGNPHGLLAFQDELSGLLMRLDADGQESSRAFYLQAWVGKQPYTFDRIGRGTVSIPRLCFSMLGGLQPSKLREYLSSAVYGGKGDDGLAQRLQLLVFPDIPANWTRVDRIPDTDAVFAADAVFERLAKIDPLAIGACCSYDGDIPRLGFDDQAQKHFNRWWGDLETDLRTSDRHPALESHISKYRKLVPAMALLDHLIVGGQGDITAVSLARAILWQRFLLEHAKRCYAAVTLATMDSAKSLTDRIRKGALKDGFTVREVYRHNWSMLGTSKEATDAVDTLADLNWLRAVRDDKASGADGRPTMRYYINPRLAVPV